MCDLPCESGARNAADEAAYLERLALVHDDLLEVGEDPRRLPADPHGDLRGDALEGRRHLARVDAVVGQAQVRDGQGAVGLQDVPASARRGV